MSIELCCEMCGSEDIVVRYSDRENCGIHSKPERLRCKCKRCEYTWVNETLKQQKSHIKTGAE